MAQNTPHLTDDELALLRFVGVDPGRVNLVTGVEIRRDVVDGIVHEAVIVHVLSRARYYFEQCKARRERDAAHWLRGLGGENLALGTPRSKRPTCCGAS